MKSEQILQKSANKNMVQWNQKDFQKTHPKLYKTIIEAINEAINFTHCCTELKYKKGTDFEEFCSEHFIYKNSNTYSKESGFPVSLNDILQKYKDLKQSL